MRIHIDLATLDDVKSAQSLGWAHSVTTSPLLFRKAGNNPYDVFRALLQLKFEQIFYQLVSPPFESMCKEA